MAPRSPRSRRSGGSSNRAARSPRSCAPAVTGLRRGARWRRGCEAEPVGTANAMVRASGATRERQPAVEEPRDVSRCCRFRLASGVTPLLAGGARHVNAAPSVEGGGSRSGPFLPGTRAVRFAWLRIAAPGLALGPVSAASPSPQGSEAVVAAPAMSASRVAHTAPTTADGRVLIVGGYGEVATLLATAELFDPATNTFATGGALAAARVSSLQAITPEPAAAAPPGDFASRGRRSHPGR